MNYVLNFCLLAYIDITIPSTFARPLGVVLGRQSSKDGSKLVSNIHVCVCSHLLLETHAFFGLRNLRTRDKPFEMPPRVPYIQQGRFGGNTPIADNDHNVRVDGELINDRREARIGYLHALELGLRFPAAQFELFHNV
mmetsp:Transcript_50048/g.50407  ORF Transcript_50048/g.50407 Transcript_50048/m.50407 type:complete len:138 (-) Transcript_50048:241-654(-)